MELIRYKTNTDTLERFVRFNMQIYIDFIVNCWQRKTENREVNLEAFPVMTVTKLHKLYISHIYDRV